MRSGRKTGSPRKRHAGPHMFVTEAQSLDEALAIIKSKQSKMKGPRKQNLAQQYAFAELQSKRKVVSLSDRATPGMYHRTKAAPVAKVRWEKEEVLRRHATGDFKLGELAHKAKVTKLQIIFWLWGVDKPPVNWVCDNCKTANCSMTLISNGFQPSCRQCRKDWFEGLHKGDVPK